MNRRRWGKPEQPPPSPSHGFTFQKPQRSHWRLVRSRCGTLLLTPAHPLWPFRSFQQDPLLSGPKIPTCPFLLSSSRRQVASSLPASAPLVITTSLPKLTVGTAIPNKGIRRGQHGVLSSFSPPSSWQNLPKSPLPAASSSPSTVRREEAAASACPAVRPAPSMAKHSRPHVGQQVSWHQQGPRRAVFALILLPLPLTSLLFNCSFHQQRRSAPGSTPPLLSAVPGPVTFLLFSPTRAVQLGLCPSSIFPLKLVMQERRENT